MGCHAVIIQSRIKMNQALTWIVTSVGQGTHGRAPWLCKQWCVSAQKLITVTHVNFRSWGCCPKRQQSRRYCGVGPRWICTSYFKMLSPCGLWFTHLLPIMRVRTAPSYTGSTVRASDFGGDRWWHHREYQKKPTTRHNWLPRMWFSEPNRRQHLEDDLETVEGLLLWVSGFYGMHVNACFATFPLCCFTLVSLVFSQPFLSPKEGTFTPENSHGLDTPATPQTLISDLLRNWPIDEGIGFQRCSGRHDSRGSLQSQ